MWATSAKLKRLHPTRGIILFWKFTIPTSCPTCNALCQIAAKCFVVRQKRSQAFFTEGSGTPDSEQSNLFLNETTSALQSWWSVGATRKHQMYYLGYKFRCLTGRLLWATLENVCLPAGHGVISVEHLLPQLAVLDPARKLNVSELITQELRPQEALQAHINTQKIR